MMRSRRVHPKTDDKILTAWNSLMISAMCKGYQVLGAEKYLRAGEKAVNFLLLNLYVNKKLLRSHRAGKSQIDGYLSDYAFLVSALIDLYESTFKIYYLEMAFEINNILLQRFWDNQHAGFFFTASDQEQLIIRTRNPYDNVIPSGNSVAIANLLRLSAFTGDFRLKEKAEQAANVYANEIQKSPLGFTALLSSLDYFWGQPKEIVIAGDRNSEKAADMITTIYNHYLPNKILAYADSTLLMENRQILSIVKGKTTNGGQVKIFVCENSICQKPFTSSDQFKDFYNSVRNNK